MSVRHQRISLLFAVTAVLLLVTCVSTLTAGGEQEKAVAVIQSRVYVKIIEPMENSEKDRHSVETWISEQLEKLGQKQARAVTDWICLPEEGEDVVRVWNGVVDDKRCGCPVAAFPVERMADGQLKVKLRGWAPVPLHQSGMSLPNEIGSRNIAVIEHGRSYVAIVVVPEYVGKP